MAEDYELPVWGVRPNWDQAVIETLEWSTDVLTSTSGAEQRVAYRLAPRRLVEARYNPMDNERTFTDLALHRLGRNEWMVPLWFDAARLTGPSAAGSSRLDLPTAFHEFSEGGMAYLVGLDCFTGEAVRIEAIDSDGLHLAVPLDKAWAAGTVIHPLRRARFESPSGGLITSRVSELTLRCEIVEGNDLADEGAWDLLHAGTPILTASPEWSQQIEIDLSWLGGDFDSETGKKFITDTAGRAFRQQQHAFILSGAQEQFEFRQLLYRLHGRQQPVWLGSQADDFTAAASHAIGSTEIDVEQVGFAYVGGPTDGRDRVMLSDGQVVQIDDAEAIGGGLERLTFADATTAAIAAGDRFGFVEICRLAADSVEIEHLGDSEGVARSTLSFAGFADRRVVAPALVGIPEAAMTSDPCGTPADEDNPCLSVFLGWYARATIESINPSTPLTGFYVHPNGVESLDFTDDNEWGNGVPKVVFETPNLVNIYWIDPDVLDAEEVDLRIQFPNGSVSNDMKVKFTWRIWDQAAILPNPGVSSIISPGTNSHSSGNPFDVRELFPDNWYFSI